MTAESQLSKLVKKFATFSAVGVIVTPLSLGSNFIFLKYFETPLYLTYVCVYAVSILLSFYLNSTFTFKTSLKFKNLVKYYSIYASGMILGVFLIAFYKYFSNFENWVYPFMAIPITMTWNFFVANKFLEKK